MGLPELFFEAGLLLEEATQLTWASGACLGELGGNLLPIFPINRLKGAVLRVLDPPGDVFQLFWVKKIVSVKKIQAEVLP